MPLLPSRAGPPDLPSMPPLLPPPMLPALAFLLLTLAVILALTGCTTDPAAARPSSRAGGISGQVGRLEAPGWGGDATRAGSGGYEGEARGSMAAFFARMQRVPLDRPWALVRELELMGV